MDLNIQNKALKHSKPRKQDFEELYSAVRVHEKKVYTDTQLQSLPDFDINSKEWEIRKHSCDRLITYLFKKNRFLRVLEVGCGNGWLAAKMADLPHSYVTGLDLNMAEIRQANRVFKKPNLEFVYDTFNDNTFDKERFDIVVFAASLQYFPSVVGVLQQAIRILNRGGEIHIVDTPFYLPEEAAKAADRCRSYYNDMGIPEMADHYFHHSISEFWGFSYRILFNPANWINRVFKKDPFYWIAISK